MILLACQTAKKLIIKLGNYVVSTGSSENDKVTLKLHIGIGAGEIGGITVGGAVCEVEGVRNAQMEFFISGPVLEQVR